MNDLVFTANLFFLGFIFLVLVLKNAVGPVSAIISMIVVSSALIFFYYPIIV